MTGTRNGQPGIEVWHDPGGKPKPLPDCIPLECVIRRGPMDLMETNKVYISVHI